MKNNRDTHPGKFFSETEKQKIVQAIRLAEQETSGEIRLHLERESKKPVFDRAVEVFNKIGMSKTGQRNGVLIYLATGNKQFVILGDEGINNLVKENFWNDVVSFMSLKFKEGEFCQGICEGVTLIGEKLKTHFPFQSDDINELSDKISVKDD